MGLHTQGIPEQITLELAQLGQCATFIESGTYRGRTTRWASGHFETVHTIERAAGLYRQHSPALRELPGVTTHLGDSREILPEIVARLGDAPALYWLDGHWSGEDTAGQDDECPLLGELACLVKRTQDILLIDDARLFLSAPPPPHDPRKWPTLPEIVSALQPSTGKRFIQVIDDVLFAVPDQDALRGRLTEYAQQRAADVDARFAAGQMSLGGHVKRLLWLIEQRLGRK